MTLSRNQQDDGNGAAGALPSRVKTFDDILTKIRDEAKNSRDLGDRFERVMLDFFKTDRHYRNRFGNRVWLWKKWARDNGISRPDEGIDIVAQERNGDLCAVQCKCYADDGSIDLKALGTFMAASKTYNMKNLILVYTGDHITEKAEHHLKKHNGAILTQETLRSAAVDWSDFPRIAPRKPHELRPYQKEALSKTVAGLKKNRRGQLLMACGTGKTLVSLRVAERVAPKDGITMYLVPSITLIQQSMRSWSENRKTDQYYIGVCSDKTVSGEEGSIAELESPVSTDSKDLRRYIKDRPKDRMTVIFCTYNSIQVVADAIGRRPIDLALCDEAHRTIGGAGDSYFTKVHEDKVIPVRNRLYMTATPKIFTDKIRKAADAQERKVYAMDDQQVYGPILYELKFDEAVHKHNALSDYRVRIAFIDPSLMDPDLQASMADDQGLLPLNDKNRMVAVWHSLLHPDQDDDIDNGNDRVERLLQRVIVFSNTIKASKRFAGDLDDGRLPDTTTADSFRGVVAKVKASKPTDKDVEVRHVDGSTRALDRKKQLRWLGESNADPQRCRILSNARCLSEGVDVPALDGVIFMEPRRSMVDVVQAVGRVMRLHPAKEYGYVILPVAVPAGEDVNSTLDDGKTWKVVWEVLNALRSHDPSIAAEINKLVLDKKISPDGSVGERIRIMSVTDQATNTGDNRFFAKFYPKLASKLVEKVGDIDYYDRYGKQLGEAASSIEHQIMVMAGRRGPMARDIQKMHDSMKVLINDSVTREGTIQMLAHHIVLSRVFDALFQGEFKSYNPISAALDGVARKARFKAELEGLENFYMDAKHELQAITTREARQNFIKKIYGNFFKSAYKKGSEKHGIVYTPVEIIDFIIRSAEHVLREQFGTSFGDRSVSVLDPFTGTGTFITRLLESEIISGDNLYEKYRSDIHANEIILLAYYVASVNIETTYQSLGETGRYVPFSGICYTDTLNTNPRYRQEKRHRAATAQLDGTFKKAHDRIRKQSKACLWVIMGNPPYSAGQSNYNDENPNISYPEVDARIKGTYALKSKSQLINSLYDSYIRAFRWASDRIDESGVVAFVTNAGFIRSEAAAGVRACLHEEFTDVWCYDLRGNQRTQGETSKREGGKIFGSGSRAPVAITILARNPDKKERHIRYKNIGDYHTTEQKLKIISDAASISGIDDWQLITPDKNHDWVEQRDDAFTNYLPMGSKEAKSGKGDAIFNIYSNGVKTNRDVWIYNSSKNELSKNMKKHINYCNSQDHNNPKIDPRQVKWSSSLSNKLIKLRSKPRFEKTMIRVALYRPFFQQYVYFEKTFVDRPGKIPTFFSNTYSNLLICVPYKFIGVFSTLITDITPDLEVVHHGQCFPMYTYEKNGEKAIQKENVTDYALKEYQAHYHDNKITKKDIFYYIYGMLHHPGYHKKYANSLSKGLPHIPLAPEFWPFRNAGQSLADVHLGYFDESRQNNRHPLGPPKNRFGKLSKMAFVKSKDPDTGKQVTDYTKLKINGILVYDNIPGTEYRVNGRTPLEWLIDRYRITTDNDSGITNNPCEKITERDVISMVERSVYVGIRSDEIVNSLPEEFEPVKWRPKKTGLDRYIDSNRQDVVH